MKFFKKTIDHLPAALIAHGIFSAIERAGKSHQNRNVEKEREEIFD